MAPIKANKNRSNSTSIEVANVLGAGTAKIKKKMRDIQRLLSKKRDSLPADVILENERALETLKVELQNAEQSLKVKKMAKKYHMVRFFERKKALRKYKQAKKEHDELIADKSEKKEIKKARKRLNHAEIDLAYVVNFPKDHKYIALFPNEEGEKVQDDNVKKGLLQTDEFRNSFKKEIENMVKENRLPISLEDAITGKTGDRMTLASSFITTKEEEIQKQEEEDEEDELFE
jgi:hypothetical protein